MYNSYIYINLYLKNHEFKYRPIKNKYASTLYQIMISNEILNKISLMIYNDTFIKNHLVKRHCEIIGVNIYPPKKITFN